MMPENHSYNDMKKYYADDLKLPYAAFKQKWRIGRDYYSYDIRESDDTSISRMDYISYLLDKRAELAARYAEGLC